MMTWGVTIQTIHDSLIKKNRLTCDCSTHAPAFTGHVLNSSPPCSLATWFFGLFFHLAQSFFLKKLPWQGGAGWLQRGAASPPFPRPGSESALKTPGNVTFPSLLSLSSRCSLLLHDLNPSFTVMPSLAPPFWKSLSLFSPSSHCFARPPLSSSLTFGSEERNSWSVRTLR